MARHMQPGPHPTRTMKRVKPQRFKNRNDEKPSTILPSRPAPSPSTSRDSNSEPVFLPDEIILQIIEYVQRLPKSQKTLGSCTLLSRQWYHAATPLLYKNPYLYGANFDPFARAICPSINLHVRKSPLSELVTVLDMGNLVHQGSRSITARLLGRIKDNIEEFTAPQASFSLNSFPALAKCHKLRKLDLSLVSEAASLQVLFNTIKGLDNLKELRLPRSSGFGAQVDTQSIVWPQRLERLLLSGGLDNHFLYGAVNLPNSLRELTIEHCPSLKGRTVLHFLQTIAYDKIPLIYLKIAHMPRVGSHALNEILNILPGLETLSVSVDYVSSGLIDGEFHDTVSPFSEYRLQALELTNSGDPGVDDKLSPLDIMISMDEGVLPHLRQVRVAKTLGWGHSTVLGEFEALADALQEAAIRQDQARQGELDLTRLARPGLWEMNDR